MSGFKPIPFLADAVIGAHGDLANWTFALVNVLVGLDARRPVRWIDRFDPIDFVVDPCPVLLANYPSNQLIDAIERKDVRVLFLLEAPLDTLRSMQRSMGLAPMEAIRSQTASAIANRAIGLSPHVRVLQRTTSRSVEQVVAMICDHLELHVPSDAQSSVADTASAGLGRNATPEAVLAELNHRSSTTQYDTALDSACQAILDPLLAMASFETARPVVWPTEVFTFSDMPSAPAPSVIAIAGPSRNLYYGPYLYLPAARYRVEAYLVFSDEIGAVPFVLEVHGGNWLAKARIEERHPGRYRGYFHLDHYDPTTTVEIRLRNESAVASGRLSLVEMLFFIENDRK